MLCYSIIEKEKLHGFFFFRFHFKGVYSKTHHPDENDSRHSGYNIVIISEIRLHLFQLSEGCSPLGNKNLNASVTQKMHTPISIRIAGHFFCIFLFWVWIPILNYNIQEGRVCKPQSLCIFNNLSHILNSFFAFTVPCLSRVQPNKC